MVQKSFLIFGLLAISITSLLFQNCGSGYSSSSSAYTNSFSEPLEEKTDTHFCSFSSAKSSSGYYIHQDPLNPLQKILYYYGRPMYGVPLENLRISGSRAISSSAIYCGAQKVVDLLPGEIVEILTDDILLLHKSQKVISQCSSLYELDYAMVQQNKGSIAQMNFEEIRSLYSVYKGPNRNMYYQPLGEGYNLFEGKVYYQLTQVIGADPATFKTLKMTKVSMAQDSQSTYFQEQRVQGRVVGTPLSLPFINVGAFFGFQEMRWMDDVSVFYKTERIGSRSQFVDLGSSWSQFGNEIYYEQKRLLSADAASFRVIPSTMFAYDKNYLYLQDRAVVFPQGVVWNPQKISVLGEKVFFDQYLILSTKTAVLVSSKDRFRCLNLGLYTDGTKLIDSTGKDVSALYPGADFQNIYSFSSQLGYFDQKNYYTKTGTRVALTNPSSFQVLNRYYYSADGKVFNGDGIALPGVDKDYIWMDNEFVATSSSIFIQGRTTPLGLVMTKSPRYLGSNYYQGDQEIFHSFVSQVIPGADITSFQILDSDVSYDKNAIYYRSQKLLNNTGGHLRMLYRGVWAVDEIVFNRGQVYAGAMASTFYAYHPQMPFFVVGTAVYHLTQKISDLATNFKSLGGYYWQDSLKVGYASMVLNAKPNVSFTISPFMNLLDAGANGVFYWGTLIPSAVSGNLQHFSNPLNGYSSFFWTDMRSVFVGLKIISGVRPNQISILPDGTATDGTNCYGLDGSTVVCQ